MNTAGNTVYEIDPLLLAPMVWWWAKGTSDP